jgi:hypothetical protein
MSQEVTKFFGDMIALHGGSDEHDDDQGWNITVKVISIVIILSITVMFGFFPYFW